MAAENNAHHRPGVSLLFAVALVLASCGTARPATPSGSPSVSPPSPLPTLASGFGRFQGTVSDALSGAALANVCVVIATDGSCQPASPRTDARGFWWIDLPSFVEWDFGWTKDGYQTVRRRLISPAGVQVVDIVLEPRP